MKEIKFRAWIDDELNDPYMANVDGINWKYGTVSTYEVKHAPEQKLKWCTLMQWTGLYDRNSKEVYEGDILKDSEGTIWEVSFEGNGWEPFNNLGHCCDMPPTFDNEGTFEVIGNIYENSELNSQVLFSWEAVKKVLEKE